MKTYEEQIQHQANTCDKSIVRARDLPLYNQVITCLRDRGLNPIIGGSVVHNALEGRQREYNDIDMKVNLDRLSKIEKNSANMTLKFFRLIENKQVYERMNMPLPEYMDRFDNPFGNDVYVISEVRGSYMGSKDIIERFRIRKGNTLVDLCFERADID